MHRSAGVRAKAKGIVEMLAVTYNRVDTYGSLWAPGCLTAGLNSRLPPLAFNHDWSEPIGRVTSWRDTAEGPVLTARLDTSPDVPRGRQVLAQIESGTLTDVSIGFHSAERREPTDAERAKYPGVREVITRASLSEVSVVLEGAVPAARVLAVRGSSHTASSLRNDFVAGRITSTQYLDAIAGRTTSRRSLAPVDLEAELRSGRISQAKYYQMKRLHSEIDDALAMLSESQRRRNHR